jgi:hypothetical protein
VDTKRERQPTIIEQIVDSSGYPELKPATVKVGFTSLSNMPQDEPVAKFSQRELLGITGYGGFKAKAAIEELQSIGILAIQRHGSRRTPFRASPLDPVFERWVETGIQRDAVHGNPVQNSGTKSLSCTGDGHSVSDQELETWRAAAYEAMKGFHSWPEEFLSSLKGNPHWRHSANGLLASQATVRCKFFASSLVPKGRRVASFY